MKNEVPADHPKSWVVDKIIEYVFESETLKDYEGNPERAIITFRNGDFAEATYFFKERRYSRDQWRFLAEVEAEITRLEFVQ